MLACAQLTPSAQRPEAQHGHGGSGADVGLRRRRRRGRGRLRLPRDVPPHGDPRALTRRGRDTGSDTQRLGYAESETRTSRLGQALTPAPPSLQDVSVLPPDSVPVAAAAAAAAAATAASSAGSAAARGLGGVALRLFFPPHAAPGPAPPGYAPPPPWAQAGPAHAAPSAPSSQWPAPPPAAAMGPGGTNRPPPFNPTVSGAPPSPAALTCGAQRAPLHFSGP